MRSTDRRQRADVDHVNAGLWLPPGGHVEPDEHPALTAGREAHEELGIVDASVVERPTFVTVTQTVGFDAGHTDVSLWFLIEYRRDQRLVPDRSEFREVRWWTPDDLRAADPARFDPHFTRLRKTSTGFLPRPASPQIEIRDDAEEWLGDGARAC